MMIDRKTFLRSVGVGAAGLLTGSSRGESTGVDGTLPEFDDKQPAAFWRSVRALYPLESDPLYLNTGGLGPASQPVLNKMFETMRQLQRHSETGHELLDPARATVARFLGADPDEICFTRNATEANSIIAAGLVLKAGDEVIFESHAHPGGSFPWLNQARQRGVKVRVFEPDASSPESNLARIRELITAKTKVIQVSHITCTTGLMMPATAIAALAREKGIWSHFDGAQSVGMIPVDVHALGCDSYAMSGHKWLGAPHETGALYLKRSQLEAVAPTGIGAYSGEITELPGKFVYRAAAARHEYGTRNAAAIVALAEAVRLQESIGRERIAVHGSGLAQLLIEQSAGIQGLEILTPRLPAMRGSMVTMRHTRADAAKFFEYLLKVHRLRCRPVTEQGLQAIRISTHVFNSEEDCTRIMSGLRAAATAL